MSICKQIITFLNSLIIILEMPKVHIFPKLLQNARKMYYVHRQNSLVVTTPLNSDKTRTILHFLVQQMRN